MATTPVKDTEFKIYDNLGNDQVLLRVGACPPAPDASLAGKTLALTVTYDSASPYAHTSAAYTEITGSAGSKPTLWITSSTLDASATMPDPNTGGLTIPLSSMIRVAGTVTTTPANGDFVYDAPGTMAWVKEVDTSATTPFARVYSCTIAGSGSVATPRSAWYASATLPTTIGPSNVSTVSTSALSNVISGSTVTVPNVGDLVYDSAGTVGYIKSATSSNTTFTILTTAGSGGSVLPAYPTTDGVYDLQLTVNGTAKTLAWATVVP